MKNLIVILAMLMLIIGCRSKTKLKQEETYKSNVEVIQEAKVEVKKEVKKDSIIKKKEEVKEKVTDTKIKVEFDPKKNDSLEILQQVGDDTIHLKIQGNGVVTFEYNSKDTHKIKEDTEIYGSQTLYNIDSTNQSKSGIKINNKATRSEKEVESNDLDLKVYIIIGISIIVLLALCFLWNRFGGGLITKFNKLRNK